MSRLTYDLKNTVAAFAVTVMFSLPAISQDTGLTGTGAENRLDTLYAELSQAEPADAARIAADIALELSKSGSPAMDLLLRRGRAALDLGDLAAADGHFTALTDHAPGFSEGWHLRAVTRARMGLLGPALADLEHALTLEPRHFTALFSLGSLLEEMGQDELASRAYMEASKLHPHDPDILAARDRLGHVTGGTRL